MSAAAENLRRPYQPPFDPGVPATRLRSLSSTNLGMLGGAPPGESSSAGRASALVSQLLAARQVGLLMKGYAFIDTKMCM
jgi:hypothetical protein